MKSQSNKDKQGPRKDSCLGERVVRVMMVTKTLLGRVVVVGQIHTTETLTARTLRPLVELVGLGLFVGTSVADGIKLGQEDGRDGDKNTKRDTKATEKRDDLGIFIHHKLKRDDDNHVERKEHHGDEDVSGFTEGRRHVADTNSQVSTPDGEHTDEEEGESDGKLVDGTLADLEGASVSRDHLVTVEFILGSRRGVEGRPKEHKELQKDKNSHTLEEDKVVQLGAVGELVAHVENAIDTVRLDEERGVHEDDEKRYSPETNVTIEVRLIGVDGEDDGGESEEAGSDEDDEVERHRCGFDDSILSEVEDDAENADEVELNQDGGHPHSRDEVARVLIKLPHTQIGHGDIDSGDTPEITTLGIGDVSKVGEVFGRREGVGVGDHADTTSVGIEVGLGGPVSFRGKRSGVEEVSRGSVPRTTFRVVAVVVAVGEID